MTNDNNTLPEEHNLDELVSDLREEYIAEPPPVSAEQVSPPSPGRELRARRSIPRWVYIVMMVIAGGLFLFAIVMMVARSGLQDSITVETTSLDESAAITPLPTPLPPTEIPVPTDVAPAPPPDPTDLPTPTFPAIPTPTDEVLAEPPTPTDLPHPPTPTFPPGP